MNQSQDRIVLSYLHNDYLRIKLEIASSFMAAMLSNPQSYTWKLLEQDQSQEQKSLEESIMVIAHDLAFATNLFRFHINSLLIAIANNSANDFKIGEKLLG